ncbi:MAG: CHAT domain-containing protein [Acidobacteriota bacterium]
MAESVRRWGGWPVVLGLALGAGVASRQQLSVAEFKGSTKDHESLIEAFAGYSPFEVRLSGFSAYTSCVNLESAPTSRCRAIRFDAQQRKNQRHAVFEIDRSGSQGRSSDLHALGIANLIRDPKYLLTAVSALEKARETAKTHQVEILNDLGAAYYVQALETKSPASFVRALEVLERAHRLSPRDSVVLFNRGLAEWRLDLDSAAIASFSAAESAEQGTGWAVESASRIVSILRLEEHIKRNSLPILSSERLLAASPRQIESWAKERPQDVRLVIEGQLLGDWVSEGNDPIRANLLLQAGLRAAKELQRIHGDELPAATLSVIERATIDRAPRIQELRAGHLAFAKGIELLEVDEPARAIAAFSIAESTLRSEGSPFSYWADFHQGVCEYYMGKTEEVLLRYAALEKEIAARPYPNLKARIDWMLGLTLMVQGQFHSSEAAYERAIDRFKETGEDGNAAYLAALTGKDLRLMGAADSSWVALAHALHNRDLVQPKERVITILRHAAESSEALGANLAATHFFDEQVAVAGQLGKAFDLCDALVRRARAATASAVPNQVVRDLQTAFSLLPSIPAALQARARADISAVRGESLVKTDPRQAMPALDSALQYYEVQGNWVETLRVDRLLAVGALAGKDFDGAERFLEDGIRLSEDQRNSISRSDQRAAYFAQAQSLFEAMIDLKLRQRLDPDGAFSFAERGRNRSLADLILTSTKAESPARRLASGRFKRLDVISALPARTSLIEYAVLTDRLVIWRLRREKSSVVEVSVSHDRLAGRLAGFRSLLLRGTSQKEIKAEAVELTAWLLPPELGPFHESEAIVFIPTGPLHEFPFSALLSPTSRRFLIEDYPLQVSPSSAIFVAATESLEKQPKTPPRVLLVVDDPAFDPSRHPTLRRLPNAALEAQEVAALYSNASRLNGSEATIEALTSRLPMVEVFSFAGHSAAPGVGVAADAGLLLAPSPRQERGNDTLTPSFISTLHLPNLRLVILSSCESALGSYPASEESASLASAFLAAGAPAVVASLWNVGDIPSRAFSVKFHRSLRDGLSPVRALQLTAGALIHNRNPKLASPSSWAAFELWGGLAP